jgi:hypothetical protein
MPFGGNPFNGGILDFHGASGYHEAFSQTLPIFTIEFWLSRSLPHEIFLFSQRTLSFFMMEFWLSGSLSHELLIFSRWNSGYQGAFLTNFFFFHDGILAIMEPFTRTFLSHDGNLAITEPFHELFFHMVESRLSRSLFTNFSFTWWNLSYHGAFSRIFLSHDGIHKMHDLGEDSFHIYHKKYLHRIRLVQNLAS